MLWGRLLGPESLIERFESPTKGFAEFHAEFCSIRPQNPKMHPNRVFGAYINLCCSLSPVVPNTQKSEYATELARAVSMSQKLRAQRKMPLNGVALKTVVLKFDFAPDRITTFP